MHGSLGSVAPRRYRDPGYIDLVDSNQPRKTRYER
jgi:hypothetical protein